MSAAVSTLPRVSGAPLAPRPGAVLDAVPGRQRRSVAGPAGRSHRRVAVLCGVGGRASRWERWPSRAFMRPGRRGENPWFSVRPLIMVMYWFRYGWGTLVTAYWSTLPWKEMPELAYDFTYNGAEENIVPATWIVLLGGFGLYLGLSARFDRIVAMMPDLRWPFDERRFKTMLAVSLPVLAVPVPGAAVPCAAVAGVRGRRGGFGDVPRNRDIRLLGVHLGDPRPTPVLASVPGGRRGRGSAGRSGGGLARRFTPPRTLSGAGLCAGQRSGAMEADSRPGAAGHLRRIRPS